MHVTVILGLSIVVFSYFGYYLNKHLLSYNRKTGEYRQDTDHTDTTKTEECYECGLG